MTYSDLNTSTLSVEEEALLKTIIERGLKEVKGKIEPEGVLFEGIEEYVIEEGYEWITILRLFENLVKKGFLISTKQEKAIICPECNSPQIFSKYSCPKCHSKDVTPIILLEHMVCGNTGILFKFESGSLLTCSKCNVEIGPIYKKPTEGYVPKDYKIIGSSFECDSCHTRFERPSIDHECQKCGINFDYKSSFYERISSYTIPESVIDKMRETEEIKVLIVEDNQSDAEIIITHFNKSKEAFEIDHVSKGSEAIQFVQKNIYDVILLDYLLPDMNGEDVLVKINELEIATPVIILTGADDRQVAVASMKLGAIDYLVKSVETFERLPSIIMQVLGKN